MKNSFFHDFSASVIFRPILSKKGRTYYRFVGTVLYTSKCLYHSSIQRNELYMKNALYNVFFFGIACLSLIVGHLQAQDCALGPDNVKSDNFDPAGTYNINTGDATPFEVLNGAEYVFKTCNSQFNTKLTLHKSVGEYSVHISSTNDNSCGQQGVGEDVTWLSDFSGTLWVTITNAGCNYTNTSAVLFIEQNDNLEIEDLQDQRASCGGNITFTATASVPDVINPTFLYQWQENLTGTWRNMSGETSQALTLSNIQASLFGSLYRVSVGLGSYKKFSNAAKIIENSVDPPSGFAATDNLCSSEIDLTWEWYSSNPINFLIEYSDAGSDVWNTLIEASGSNRSYLHEGVERGRGYNYRISSYSEICGNYTNSSSIVEGISPTIPVPPTNVLGEIVNGNDGSNIEVTWQDNSDNEEGFRLHKLGENGNSESFRIRSSKYDRKSTGQSFRYLDVDASNCEPYTYRVYAYNVCSQDGVRDVTEVSEITLTVPLDDILSISALEASCGYYPDRIFLNWNYEQNSNYRYANGYKIYARELSSTVSPQLVQNVSREIFSWETDNTRAGVLYEYFLVASGLCGNEELFSYAILDSLSTLQARIPTDGALVDVLPEQGLGYAIGFRSPAGLIHGNISYVGGVSVPNVKVGVSRNSGTAGHALYFDGSDDYVEMGSTTYLDRLNDSFSVAAWIRPEQLKSDIQFIVNKTGTFALGTSDDDIFFYATDGSNGWYRVNAPDVLSAGQYVHITVTYDQGEVKIYINGDFLLASTVPPSVFNGSDHFFIGGVPWGTDGYFFQGYIDELRLFSGALDETRIKKDFSRLISSAATDLVAYWRMEEAAGPYLFDFARSQGVFHQNDGRLHGAQWSDVVPTQRQLGMAGYTDKVGNYTVDGIFYGGTGESFNVTPTITLAGAVHEFAPVQRLEYIGEAASILNNIDFEDISSFRVTGQVLFEHNNVFSGSPGVTFYIGGTTPIIGSNGQLVTSAEDGSFDIQVPIGLHSIAAKKAYHVFKNDGKWPTLSDKHDFQADVNGIIFTDTTRRKLIGRVVGGLVEAEKAVGFGLSKNNIGQANFILRSQDGIIESNITTDIQSGEFSVELPPKRYTVYKGALPTEGGVSVVNNVEAENFFINLPPLDLSNVVQEKWEENPIYDQNNPQLLLSTDSVAYHLMHNFVYRSVPQITVTDGRENMQDQPFVGETTYTYKNVQGFEDVISLGYGTYGGIPYPVFKKLHPYKMRIALIEEYTNRDQVGSPVISQSPVMDGDLTIANFIGKGFYESASGVQYYTIGAPGNNPDLIKLDDTRGDTLYSFVASEPDIALNTADLANSFTRTLHITARVAGNVVYWPGPDQQQLFRGYVFGSTPVGSSFVTKAPDMVDFILRDPPGSGSVTEFSKGSSITSTNTLSLATSYGLAVESSIGAGVTTFTGAGIGVFAGIVNEASAQATVGFEFSVGLGYEGEWVETYTMEESFATSEDLVGAEGDVYVGKSQNYRFGLSQSMSLVPDEECDTDEVGCPFDEESDKILLTGASGKTYQIGSKIGLFLTPEGSPTFFVYTQTHITEELIPQLQELRNTLLLDNPKYTSQVSGDNDLYGSNNDDPNWSNPTSSYPETDPALDFDGPSYTFVPSSNEDVDSVRWYNQQIRLWEESVASNEQAKVNAVNSGSGENKSFSALASYTATSTSTRSENHSFSFETAAGASIGFDTDISLFGLALSLNIQQNISVESGYSHGHGTEQEVSYSYTLSDEDEGDFFSVDVFSGENNNSPIFIIKDGGESSCPHEGAFVTEYYQPGTVLGSGTLQRDKPRLEVAVPTFYNVPSNVPAVYTLTLYNDSESRDDRDYVLDIVDDSNPNGAAITIDGKTVDGSSVYSVSAGSTVQKTMLVHKGPYEYSYEEITIEMLSACDEEINDEASFSAYFSPTCTELTIRTPQDNWVMNSNFQDTLSITVGEYNINHEGLESVELRYRPSSSSIWMWLETFHRDTTGMNAANLREIPRDKPSLTYSWDLTQLPDAHYDIIAVSNCTAPDIGTEISTESEIFSGLVDRLRPHAFGRPQPADGILSPSDEIMIQLNEPINTGSLSPQNFDIRGVLNGGEIRHAASMAFDGDESHYMRIVEGAIDLSKKSFSIDFYARRSGTGSAVLFAQGKQAQSALKIGFDASDRLYFSLAGENLTTIRAITDNAWHHYAITYDIEGSNASLTVDANDVVVSNTFSTVYPGRGEIYVGKSTVEAAPLPFYGNIHELRIWNKVLSVGDVSIAAVKRMSKATLGLIANWRMEEGTGDVAHEHLRSKHADVYADWQLEPSGYALAFDGIDQYAEALSPGFGNSYDFSIELWFKSNQAKEACFLSNGRGDAQDLNIDAWSIGIKADGNVFVRNSGARLVSNGKNYQDGRWHHLALSVNRVGNALLYVDGEQLTSVRSHLFNAFAGPKLWIGARGWFEGSAEHRDNYLDGAVDEIRIWNSARRDTQFEIGRYSKLNGDELDLERYYSFEDYTLDAGVFTVTTSVASFVNALEEDLLTLYGGATHSNQPPPIQLARPVSRLPFSFSANEDRIILSPDISNELIENIALDITVKGLTDLHGNMLASPVTWSAYVDRNQVVWEEESRIFEIEAGEDLTFQTSIRNNSGTVQQFALHNLPVWLSVTPQSGTILPLSTREMTFTIREGINIGQYVQDVYLRSDFGFDERFVLDVKVRKLPPTDWEINPADYQFSMSVIGQVRMDGAISRDPENKVVAYVGDKPSGIASLQYVPALDTYIAFLSVYSNIDEGERVTFRVWNAAEGQVHSRVTPVLPFHANTLHGSIDSPLLLEVSDFIHKQKILQAGWQWVSFNVLDPSMSDVSEFMLDLEATPGDVIKGGDGFDQYAEDLGWIGSLTEKGGISLLSNYKIKLSNSDTLYYEGAPVNPESMVVSLSPGWNWVGYTVQKKLSITAALSNFNPTLGAQIKSQHQFAIYAGGTVGWVGSLAYLEPGKGYMIFSTEATSFTYPNITAAYSTQATATETRIQQQMELLDPSKYQSNATVIAKVSNLSITEDDLLFAIINGEKRGVGQFKDLSDGRKIAFVTVFGNKNGDAIDFLVHSADSKQETRLATEKDIIFQIDAQIGTIIKPIAMHPLDGAARTGTLQIVPNPLVNNMTILFDNPAERLQRVEIFLRKWRAIYYRAGSICDLKGIHNAFVRMDRHSGRPNCQNSQISRSIPAEPYVNK